MTVSNTRFVEQKVYGLAVEQRRWTPGLASESPVAKFEKVQMLQQDLTVKCGNILFSFFMICGRRNGDGQTENNMQTLPVLCMIRHPAV